ncbi:hypothetical protein LCGC14_1206350, partial [marine sediment metagenome]
KGLKDLKNTDFPSDRIRRKQKRKKSARITDPKILKIFNNLVKDDGQNGLILKWTTKSIRGIKNEFDQKGFNISERGVWNTLQKQNYSLQADKCLRDKIENVDIDDLMVHICGKAGEFISASQTVISLFLKTFEFKYDKQNRVEHDYLSAWLGWKSIMKWWDKIGREYPSLKQLLICMDTNRGKCFYSKINYIIFFIYFFSFFTFGFLDFLGLISTMVVPCSSAFCFFGLSTWMPIPISLSISVVWIL